MRFTGFFHIFCLAGAVAVPNVGICAGTRAPPACGADATGSGTVRAIVDGRSFVLDDGREIRLAGIEVPLPPGRADTGARVEAALAASRAAQAALESMLAGRSVEFRHHGHDRYGRLLAYVAVIRDGARHGVAQGMLASGDARVSGEVADAACAAELLARERAARAAGIGLWGRANYAVMGAEDHAGLAAEHGRFALVEGRVLSVRESAGTIYMNFGRRWSQALTVTILKRNERSLAAAGIEPKRLENRRVRVRGWVEERSGPRIEVKNPGQIEIAERN